MFFRANTMFPDFAGELRVGLTNANYPHILNVLGRFALVPGEVFPCLVTYRNKKK
jgi:hypothetical protein